MAGNTKQCNTCLEHKPATTEYFYKRADSADGLRGDCKACKIENTLKNKAARDSD
jgi:hypothetical protein